MRSSRNGEYAIYEEPVEPKRGNGGKVILVLLIAAIVAVAVIGVSKVGTFISDKIVTPVASLIKPEDETESGDEKITEAQTAGMVTESFELSESLFYALQVGVFSSDTNAEVFAGELKARGGAGYVLSDSGNYRVIIAGYGEKADAESVRERLEKEQGMESKLLEIKAEAKGFTVTADEESIESVRMGVETVNGIVPRLCALSINLDKGEITLEQAAESIDEMVEELEKLAADLGKIEEKGGAAEVLGECIERTAKAVKSIGKDSLTEASGGIKMAYIEAALARRDMGTDA